MKRAGGRKGKGKGTTSLTYRGRTQSIAAWAREVGMDYDTLYKRVASGWPTNKALRAPAKPAPRPLTLTHRGKTMSIGRWAEKAGLTYGTLYWRVRKLKWKAKAAIETPARGQRR